MRIALTSRDPPLTAASPPCPVRYPLLTVAMEGSIMLLRFLLNSGTNIETKSDMGNTALLYAAQVRRAISHVVLLTLYYVARRVYLARCTPSRASDLARF
jgi:hypothetical protein